MTFLWPQALALLLAIPAFLAFYGRVARRRRALASHRLAPESPPEAAGERAWRAQLPLALFLCSIVALCVAIARPHAPIATVASDATIVLAIDVSASMGADDASGSRLARSQALAKEFLARHADGMRVGLVAFSAGATAALAPTTQATAVRAAIDRLTVHHGTAIGSGIGSALAMIFPQAAVDPATLRVGREEALPRAPEPERPGDARPHAAPGAHRSAAIVLFSDGQSTGGPDPLAAARLAARLGVRIHAIGIGTPEGRRMRLEGWTMRVRLDEPALEAVAATSAGAYYRAADVDWARIASALEPRAVSEIRQTEITALLCALAALIACAGAFLSLTRHQRIL